MRLMTYVFLKESEIEIQCMAGLCTRIDSVMDLFVPKAVMLVASFFSLLPFHRAQ
jgi:hypothetical protein